MGEADFMYEFLRSVAQANGGFLTSADAVKCGCGASELRALLRDGVLARLRRDLYAFPGEHIDRPDRRHAVLARGVLARYQGRIAPSHHTAVILAGLPTWGVPYERPSFVRVAGAHAESSRFIRVGPALAGEAMCRTSSGLSVKAGVAGLHTAMSFGVEAGVVSLDAALARGLTDRLELSAWLGRLAGQRHRSRAVRAVDLADARSESPGESRLRVRLVGLGFADLEPQIVIRVRSQVLGRVDLYDRKRRIAIEFDGAVKYQGSAGSDALLAEKAREDRLRSYGVGFARFVWHDLDRPDILKAKMLRAIEAQR